MPIPRNSASIATASVLLCATALAAFTNPFVPAFRGSAQSEFAAWESFASAFGAPNAPDDPLSTALDARVEQLVPGAIDPGSGNIYHPSAPPRFRLTDTVPGDLQEVVFQVSTWGAEIVYRDVTLNYVDAQGQSRRLPPTTYEERARYPALGWNVESLYGWDLGAIAEVVSAYSVDFYALTPHVSLDAVILDARWIPGDGALISYCDPGSGGVAPCPCANPPSTPGRGCDNFTASSGGAVLSGGGSGSLSSDTLVLTAADVNHGASTIFLQGDASSAGGVSFGAGVRCVAGSLKRLYAGSALNGSITRPAAGDLPVSGMSAVLGDPIQAGSTRYYLAYYRDPLAVAACGSSTASFNATQGGRVTWLP